MSLRYPSFEAAIEFNKRETEESGEEYLLEDPERLGKILNDVRRIGKGLPLREGIVKKAAFLLFSITSAQPFHEANKRTAYVTTKAFLTANGFRIEAPKAEIFEILEGVIFTRVSLNGVEEWLKTKVIRK